MQKQKVYEIFSADRPKKIMFNISKNNFTRNDGCRNNFLFEEPMLNFERKREKSNYI